MAASFSGDVAVGITAINGTPINRAKYASETGSSRPVVEHKVTEAAVEDPAEPRVDYELTPLGREALEPVAALATWAMLRRTDIEAARAVFDQKSLRP